MSHDSDLSRAVAHAWRHTLVTHVVVHTRLLHHLLDTQVCELRFTPPGTGHPVSVPVRYASGGEYLVVPVPRSGGGAWWEPFAARYPLRVLLDRRWRAGLGRLVVADQPAWREARRVYDRCFPQVPSAETDVFLAVRIVAPARDLIRSRPFNGGPPGIEGPWWTW